MRWVTLRPGDEAVGIVGAQRQDKGGGRKAEQQLSLLPSLWHSFEAANGDATRHGFARTGRPVRRGPQPAAAAKLKPDVARG